MRGCKAHHWEAEELKRKDLNLHFADGTWKKRCKTFVSKKMRSCRKMTKEFSIDFQNGLLEILGKGFSCSSKADLPSWGWD